MLIILLSNLLNIFSPTAMAQAKPGDAEKIATLVIAGDVDACKAYFPECGKLYELISSSRPQSLELKFKSAAVFGTVYEFTEACSEGDKNTCDMVKAIFDDTKDDCQKFSKENNALCSDIKSYRLNTCEKIQDSFIGSMCSKKLLPACRNDLMCMLAWSFAFREDAERLKTTSPSILKAFIKQYGDDTNLFKGNLKILDSQMIKKSEIVRATLFPSPKRILDFSATGTTKNKIIPKVKPEFKLLSTVKAAFTPNMSQINQPWGRGVGMTVVDWDGDGYMDVFTIDGDNILFFENMDGREFRKFTINLPSLGIKSPMVDISVADIDGDGTPAILVQLFPKNIYVLRWAQDSTFLSELITLPNFSRTHAYVKFKKGLGIIFPGWAGISSVTNNMANDYIARIENKKWIFEKLSNSQAPTLGISVVEKVNGHSVVAINKDLEGGTDFYTVGDNSLTKIPDSGKMNYYANSTAFLKTSKNEELWLTSGYGLNSSSSAGPKRKILLPPKNIEECKKLTISSEKDFCILRFNRHLTSIWPSLCLLYNPEYVQTCYMQNDVPGIRNIKMKDPLHYSAQVFKNLNSPIIDAASSKIVADLPQFWHMAPLQSPAMEGFIVSEARANSARARKLWWLGLTKTGMQKFDLTSSLCLPESYGADNFALADFDRDGQLDIVFKSGNDMVFFKGNTGGDSGLTGNLQSGHLSRTLIKMPVNSKE